MFSSFDFVPIKKHSTGTFVHVSEHIIPAKRKSSGIKKGLKNTIKLLIALLGLK